MEIDVCLVAGRRPDLLRCTLESFNSNLLSNFAVKQFIANIDPVFGSEEDAQCCEAIIRSHFPDAHVTKPETPGFCAAVRHNWAATTADIILHMEDDWVLHAPVTPSDISAFDTNPLISQISFNHAFKQWPTKEKGPFEYARRRINILGLKSPFKTRRQPVFTTSPSFLRGVFARACVPLMNDRLDPEKQFFKGVNLPLERFVASYLNMVIGDTPDYLISDTGRDWREERRIEKTLIDWQSVWVSG